MKPLPAAPETVALYLTAFAGHLKVSTLERRLSSISQAHQLAAVDSPAHSIKVGAVFAGIWRTWGVAYAQKAPLLKTDLVSIVGAIPADSLIGAAAIAHFSL